MSLLKMQGLGLTLLLLAGCQSVPPIPQSDLETPQALEAQSSRSTLTFAEKQEVNRHGGMVRKAARVLLYANPELTSATVASAFQKVCKRGAQSITVKGKIFSLKEFPIFIYPNMTTLDVSFGAAPSRVLACLVQPKNNDASDVRVWLLTREGYLSIDGSFPPGDPDLLNPEIQRKAIRAHSANVYKAGMAILAEDVRRNPLDVASSLQAVCKIGAPNISVGGVQTFYGFGAAPATTTVCTVVPGDDYDITVTVGSTLGFSSVNGAEPTP